MQRLINNSGNAVQNVNNNTYLCWLYFKLKYTLLIENLIKELPGYAWHWLRFEFQGRGSVHIHGFIRFDRDDNMQFEDLGLKIKNLFAEKQKEISLKYEAMKIESKED